MSKPTSPTRTAPPLRPELRMTGRQARELAAALIAAAIEADAAEQPRATRHRRSAETAIDPHPADLVERKGELQYAMAVVPPVPCAPSVERAAFADGVEVRGAPLVLSAPPRASDGDWLAADSTTQSRQLAAMSMGTDRVAGNPEE
jgi:hypothetical protein